MAEQIKDSGFWKQQILKAKSDNKDYYAQAEAAEKAYGEATSYNIFYSNIQTLKANLLTNTPKPDVERRFIKKAASNRLQYNTFITVSNVIEACLTYFTDIENLQPKLKDLIEQAKKTGRGVAWITYEPTIDTVGEDEQGNPIEDITGRDIKIETISYKDYLCSTVEKQELIWWKARKHLLDKSELLKKFNFDATKDKGFFSKFFGSDNERKLAEVWEIWDKTEKKRHYLYLVGGTAKILKSGDDPYKLDGFFPCAEFTPLTASDTIIPKPEYEIYKSKAKELDKVSKLGDKLEAAIKYVITTDVANQDNVAAMNNAEEGGIVTLHSPNPLSSDPAGSTGYLPIDAAINLATHREDKKLTLKQDIYDITGISDIMRGQTDAQETAAAQKIKGVFGSLRFQDQQKEVQSLVVAIYRIIAEIISEHFDAKTLQDITSIYLPTTKEKVALQFKIQQAELTQEERANLDNPTWEDVLNILRSEKLRNYTVDIQSTATVFDDLSMQNESISQLVLAYKDVISTAMQFNNPAVIRGFIPIAKMLLTNIKTGRAVAKQMIEAIEGAADELEKNLKANAGQVPPEVAIQQQELALKQQEVQARIQLDMVRAQSEMLKEQNRAKELALKEQGIISDTQYQTDTIAIKQQEANRKDKELEVQARLKAAEIASGININANIAGDVPSLG